MRIRPNAIGLFFAKSVDHVKMAWIFCLEHHASEYNPEKMLLCNCRKSALKKAYNHYGGGGGGGGGGQRDQVARRREVGGGRVSPWDEDSVAVDVGAGLFEEGEGVKRRRRGGHSQHQHQHHGHNKKGAYPDLLDMALMVDDKGARPGGILFKKNYVSNNCSCPPGGDERVMLDTTGAFHWCPNQTLERCTLDGDQVAASTSICNISRFYGFWNR